MYRKMSSPCPLVKLDCNVLFCYPKMSHKHTVTTGAKEVASY